MSPHLNTPDQELFWGADQYDFSVVLPSAGTECFWHFAHHGETFYLSFMVQWVTGIGNARHLTVTVNAPGGLLVSMLDDAKGQVNFKATETGSWFGCGYGRVAMCLWHRQRAFWDKWGSLIG
ncbi:Transmembrane emp24 domain-containing protein 6 [Oryzias melastigma]|uniref:Transmembrane emp24 domain-containing protein 6 n=1 Tax=Oryzias melastigma TaxID=30732 RepID=A0A834F5J3_ORYME|nr:Transmembrane emp24 domain-containing protein 6 [Oryzias melastigma]